MQYNPVIDELKLIINRNATLKYWLKFAIKSMPEGSYWHDKTISSICPFFHEWLFYTPNPSMPFKFITPFNQLVYSPSGMQFIRTPEITSWLSKFFKERGKYIDNEASACYLDQWMKDSRININQYIIPEGGYKSFNAFFMRKLKKKQRQIDGVGNDQILVSPNDGTMQIVIPEIKNTSEIKVKGDQFYINEIFNGNALSNQFLGGPVILSELGIYDYHHYHAPISGRIVAADTLAGLYDSGSSPEMYEITYKHRRNIYIFENECVGLVGMVPIGFWMVGSVNFNKKKGDYVHKGDNIGHFAYNGSAILLFFQPNKIKLTKTFKQKTLSIKVGEEFARVLVEL